MLKHDIPELDRKGLRQFGLMMAGFIAGIFGLVLPWIGGLAHPLWPWATGAVFMCWSLAAPASLRPVYMGWMRIAMVIGGVINHLVLAVVFYVVMLPMGLVMRAMGKDPMARKFDRTLASYRVMSKVPGRNHMERPY
ncbi:MAG: SxtJ family membrane protein [Mariprofundaceae bacterium]|nr:SxtJ family membrane protein [Mariprofundaceae bacterium]